MDSLTQAALGACVGWVLGHKEMGHGRSLALGAFAGTLPDLDILPILPFDNDFIYLKYHRGFSHSLAFTVLGSALAAYLGRRWIKSLSSRQVFRFFFYCFFTHILLDCFTTWGTQVFWPLPYRVAWHSIFIVDFFYTVPLLIGIAGVLFSKAKKQRWMWGALVVSSLYLLLSLAIQRHVDGKFAALFKSHDIAILRQMTRPSPFNLVLWSCSAESEMGYYYATISLFDTRYEDQLFFTPKHHDLLEGYVNEDVADLLGYTKGFYSVEKNTDGVWVHDMRYGFLGDPRQNSTQYVFSYWLKYNDSGQIDLLVKNPRPENSTVLLGQLWKRLNGI